MRPLAFSEALNDLVQLKAGVFAELVRSLRSAQSGPSLGEGAGRDVAQLFA